MIGFKEASLEKLPTEIVSLQDPRLEFIDTRRKGFYDLVLDYKSNETRIIKFQQAIQDIKEWNLPPFYIPKIKVAYSYANVRDYEGSLHTFEKIVFPKSKRHFVNLPYSKWEKLVKDMPTIEGKGWNIGSELQYYAYLVYLINKHINKGCTIKQAIKKVTVDSTSIVEDEFDEFIYLYLRCSVGAAGSFWVVGLYRRPLCLAEIEHIGPIVYDGKDDFFADPFLVLG